MNRKKDYITPWLVVHQLRPIRVMQASGILTKYPNDTTQGDVDDNEDDEFDGLFD